MAHAMAGRASRCMLRQGDLADACYGKANRQKHTAVRGTRAVLFRMGLECGVLRASNYSLYF